jgi:hypothetical protein
MKPLLIINKKVLLIKEARKFFGPSFISLPEDIETLITESINLTGDELEKLWNKI